MSLYEEGKIVLDDLKKSSSSENAQPLIYPISTLASRCDLVQLTRSIVDWMSCIDKKLELLDIQNLKEQIQILDKKISELQKLVESILTKSEEDFVSSYSSPSNQSESSCDYSICKCKRYTETSDGYGIIEDSE